MLLKVRIALGIITTQEENTDVKKTNYFSSIASKISPSDNSSCGEKYNTPLFYSKAIPT